MGVISQDPNDRTFLASAKFVGAFAAGIIISATLLPMTKLLGGGNAARGWQLAFIVVGLAAIAFFLISRYTHPPDLLTVSANTGGNTDTIAFLCGAYLGAARGMDALPQDLLEGLEDRDRIELLGQRLYNVCCRKLE